MGSVASELKSEREKRKIPLAQIAADTRISLRYLESLEEGRYGDLPGGIYNRAFLRAYCESLNLDQSEIIQRYEAEISPFPEKPLKSKTRIPPRKSSLRAGSLAIWSILLLISASGIYFSRKWIAAVFSPYFSHAPSMSAHLKHAQQPAALPYAGERPSPAVTPATAPSPPADSQTAGPLTAHEAPAQASPVPTGRVSPSAAISRLRLEIVVTEKCWISVNSDGTRVLRRELEAGEVQSLNAAEEFYLILGNAGGVHLRINDKPAKPLGKRGEVVKLRINMKNLPELIDQTAG
jgi:cytoskeleton protein RodZ